MTRLLATLLLLATGWVVSGCGGGSSPTPESAGGPWRAEAGSAQKGPLVRGSWVSLGELLPGSLQPSGASYNLEVADDLGRFDPRAIDFGSRYLEATALGYYFDEVSGRTSSSMIVLRALADLQVDRSINVNMLTDLSRARIRSQVASSAQGFAAARLAAQRGALARFFIYNSADLMPGGATDPAHFGELDIGAGRDADDMLAAVSAVLVEAGGSPAGITRLLSDFEADLADNGSVDNSIGASPSVAALVNGASRRVDWVRVAANLNRFYRTDRFLADRLRQWIDTSGGVDRVIDRHKHSQEGVPAGAEALSPGYTAGSDDHGQCVAAEGGTLVHEGRVQAGPVRASRGDVFHLSLTSTTPGSATETAFLRRWAPQAGECAPSVPAASATRLAKWSVTFTNGVVQIAGGSAGHSLAVMSDGTLYAWGNNSHGQVGDGTTTHRSRPVAVGSDFVAAAAGVRFSVGVKRDGTLWTWGDNEFGALGDGTRTGSAVPRQVGTGFVTASARGSFVVALKANGTLWSWGHNNFGQLGDGTATSSLVPQQVGRGYLAVSAGSNFVLARKTGVDGIWGWGTNLYGQMGLGSTGWNVSQQTRLSAEPHRQVSAGWDHSMALGSEGQLRVWGLNENCQVGDGQQGNVLSPKVIGTGFARIGAGGAHSTAIKDDGTLWAWGWNAFGQLGDGSTTTACTPVQIGTGFREVVAGNHHTLALKTDGSLWAWGHNEFGQVGDGTTVNRTRPTRVDLPPTP